MPLSAAGFWRRVGDATTAAFASVASRRDSGDFTPAPIHAARVAWGARYHLSTRSCRRCPSAPFIPESHVYLNLTQAADPVDQCEPAMSAPSRSVPVQSPSASGLRDIERQATFSITVFVEMRLRRCHDPGAHALGDIGVLRLVPRFINLHAERQPALEIAVVDEVLFGGRDL